MKEQFLLNLPKTQLRELHQHFLPQRKWEKKPVNYLVKNLMTIPYKELVNQLGENDLKEVA